MPARERGANLDLTRRITAVRKPPPATTNLRSTSLSSEPFKPAQQQAQKRVVQAQKALPREPVPHIPYIANPTPAQTHAVKLIVQEHANASGYKPTYWKELTNDPHPEAQRYIALVRHYINAARGHEAATVGRRVDPALAAAARSEAVAIGRRLLGQVNPATAKPAPAPQDIGIPTFGLANIRIPGTANLASGLGHALASITPGLQSATPETQFFKNLGKDALGIGELPLVGGYQVANAGLQGLTGNLQPSKQLASGIVQGLEHGAAGQLLKGNLSGAEQAVREHPLYSVLEALGATGVAGRTAGALARGAGTDVEAAGLGGALARVGSTVRPPIALVDDAGAAKQGLIRQRTYSRDLLRKGGQVAADSRREPLLDAEGHPVTIRDRGRTVPVFKPQERLLRSEEESLAKKRGNFEAARTQSVEHIERENIRKAVNEIESPGRTPSGLRGTLSKELVHLVATGTIRSAQTFKDDLEKRAKAVEEQVKNEGQYRTRAELNSAKSNARLLRQAANSKTVAKQISKIVTQGERVGALRKHLDERLIGLNVHPRGELERSALSEYALAHMGAVHDGDALRDPQGRVLTNQQIREHAASAGRNPDTLAHLPHVIESGDKRAYHRQFRVSARPAPAHVSRTGSLFARGGNVFGRQVVRDALTRSATTANLAQAVDKFVHEAGLRKPDGSHFTPKEALEAANRFQQEGGDPRFVPVRAFAAKLPKETRQGIADAQSSAQFETAHHRLLNSRVITDQSHDIGNSTPNAVLVPKHLHDALEAQLQPSSQLERSVQLLNGPFRMAVLPQPRWLTGNFIEPYLVRLPLAGAGINLPGAALDVAAGRKALRELERSGDPAQVRAAKEIRAQQFGGLFIGRRGASVRRTYQDFSGPTGRALYGAHVLRNLPAVKQLGDLTLSLPHAFFHVNRVIESMAQQQAFGKSVRRDVQEITGKWSQTVLLARKAVHEAAEGLVDTPTQHRLMEDQYELLGQYTGQNPTVKRLIQTVAPFLPWTLASARFVFWTLPAHHTVAFVGLLKAAQSVQADWEKQHADLPPGTLRDALIRPDGGLIDVARYTPYGATSPVVQGDLSNLTNTILPQLSGSLKATEGQDPFGRPLQVPKTLGNPKGEPTGGQKAGIAAYSALESLVPLLSQARRLQEKGGTAYGNSTVFSPKVKPETSHSSAINRTLNPFRETYLKAPKGGRASGEARSQAKATLNDPYIKQEIEQARKESKAALDDPYVKAEIEEAKREAAGR